LPKVVQRVLGRLLGSDVTDPVLDVYMEEDRVVRVRTCCAAARRTRSPTRGACAHLFRGEWRLQRAPKQAGAGWLYRQSNGDREAAAADPPIP
jgi:hypothetical protein